MHLHVVYINFSQRSRKRNLVSAKEQNESMDVVTRDTNYYIYCNGSTAIALLYVKKLVIRQIEENIFVVGLLQNKTALLSLGKELVKHVLGGQFREIC